MLPGMPPAFLSQLRASLQQCAVQSVHWERADRLQLGLCPTQWFGPWTVAGLRQDSGCLLHTLVLEGVVRGWQHLR